MQGGRLLGVFLARRVAFGALVLVFLTAACGGPASSSGASPSPSASVAGTGSVAAATESAAGSAKPSPAVTAKPVASVKGSGFVDSKAFTLPAASYVVRWTITAADTAGCSAIGAIHSPDGRVSVEVANTTFTGKGTRSGSKSASDLPAGSYLVTFATTCNWVAQVYRA